MGLLDFVRRPDINRGVEDCRRTPGAVLLDVRSAQEHRAGHIPGSINIPLQTIEKIHAAVKNKDTPLFVYCQSGARSSRAVSSLRHMGYQNLKNIGGIAAYSGKVV